MAFKSPIGSRSRGPRRHLRRNFLRESDAAAAEKFGNSKRRLLPYSAQSWAKRKSIKIVSVYNGAQFDSPGKSIKVVGRGRGVNVRRYSEVYTAAHSVVAAAGGESVASVVSVSSSWGGRERGRERERERERVPKGKADSENKEKFSFAAPPCERQKTLREYV